MGVEQYHEPPEELSQDTRTIARILTSMTEEAEAIGWYEQRLSIEQFRLAVFWALMLTGVYTFASRVL